MNKREVAFIGLWLPSYTVSTIALLILVSFASCTISAMLLIDKLILFAIGSSPVVFTSGAIVCAIALVKRKNTITALVGVVLNIVLLAALLYFFADPFLTELRILN